jgi:hypothetical protein
MGGGDVNLPAKAKPKPAAGMFGKAHEKKEAAGHHGSSTQDMRSLMTQMAFLQSKLDHQTEMMLNMSRNMMALTRQLGLETGTMTPSMSMVPVGGASGGKISRPSTATKKVQVIPVNSLANQHHVHPERNQSIADVVPMTRPNAGDDHMDVENCN